MALLLMVKSSLTFFQVLVLDIPPNYPQSNGFIERQIQTVKCLMEKATATGKSFQEALTGLRAQPLGDGLPSPAEILHGRSLTTRKATPVDIKAYMIL